MASGEKVLTVGVLAMQGAFREHYHHIERLNPLQASKTSLTSEPRLRPVLVRSTVDLAKCDALIIPGGESTAISLGAQRAGLLEPLRDWVAEGRPTWGTCAGMILLAREATGIKKGGQELLGGMDIRVGRNGFGSQVRMKYRGHFLGGVDRMLSVRHLFPLRRSTRLSARSACLA